MDRPFYASYYIDDANNLTSNTALEFKMDFKADGIDSFFGDLEVVIDVPIPVGCFAGSISPTAATGIASGTVGPISCIEKCAANGNKRYAFLSVGNTCHCHEEIPANMVIFLYCILSKKLFLLKNLIFRC